MSTVMSSLLLTPTKQNFPKFHKKSINHDYKYNWFQGQIESDQNPNLTWRINFLDGDKVTLPEEKMLSDSGVASKTEEHDLDPFLSKPSAREISKYILHKLIDIWSSIINHVSPTNVKKKTFWQNVELQYGEQLQQR